MTPLEPLWTSCRRGGWVRRKPQGIEYDWKVQSNRGKGSKGGHHDTDISGSEFQANADFVGMRMVVRVRTFLQPCYSRSKRYRKRRMQRLRPRHSLHIFLSTVSVNIQFQKTPTKSACDPIETLCFTWADAVIGRAIIWSAADKIELLGSKQVGCMIKYKATSFGIIEQKSWINQGLCSVLQHVE